MSIVLYAGHKMKKFIHMYLKLNKSVCLKDKRPSRNRQSDQNLKRGIEITVIPLT